MSAKERKKKLLDKNQLLMILVALLVVTVTYAVITNYNAETETSYSPDAVFNNPDDFLGKNVIVKGYYYDDNKPGGRGVVTSTKITGAASSTETIIRLPIDYSTVNTTGLLLPDVKYKFTGIYTEEDVEIGKSYIFIVTSIKE